MLAYFDRDQQAKMEEMARYHPWTVTLSSTDGVPNGRYVDFKLSPELIGSTLEDLPRVAGGPAEAAIVDFLAWANAPGGAFETNDFGVRPLRPNDSDISSKAMEQICRVTVFFRDLQRNTNAGDLPGFAFQMEDQLNRIDAEFDQACWGWSLWPHHFLAVAGEGDPAGEGDVISYMLWAWGDDAHEVQTHMVRAFENLREALDLTMRRRT